MNNIALFKRTKKWGLPVIIGIILCSIFIFSACTKSESEYFTALEEKYSTLLPDITAAQEAVTTAKEVEIKYERMTNYDAENRVFPTDKDPSEKKNWNKTAPEIDSAAVLEGLKITPDVRGLYSVEKRSWLTDTMYSYRLYSVLALDGAEYIYYRDSVRASKFGEDLTFDWENIKEVKIETVCWTVTSGKTTKVEYLVEIVGSYHKTVNQIWNNSNAVEWLGDRIQATSFLFLF